ncbi:unnamed protein product, partial [Protopolystoma xenopodis]
MSAIAKDVDLVFTNAQQYNLEESIIHQDSITLRNLAIRKVQDLITTYGETGSSRSPRRSSAASSPHSALPSPGATSLVYSVGQITPGSSSLGYQGPGTSVGSGLTTLGGQTTPQHNQQPGIMIASGPATAGQVMSIPGASGSISGPTGILYSPGQINSPPNLAGMLVTASGHVNNPNVPGQHVVQLEPGQLVYSTSQSLHPHAYHAHHPHHTGLQTASQSSYIGSNGQTLPPGSLYAVASGNSATAAEAL